MTPTADLIADHTADPHTRPHRRHHRRPSHPTITAALRARNFRAHAAMRVAASARPSDEAGGMAGAKARAASGALPRAARPAQATRREGGQTRTPAGLCGAEERRRLFATDPKGRGLFAAVATERSTGRGRRGCTTDRRGARRGAPRGGLRSLRQCALPLPCRPPRSEAERDPQRAWRQGRGICALAMPP